MKTIAHLKAVVPEQRFAVKARKTIVGLGFVALGVWLVRIGATQAPASLWLIGIGVGLCIFGALGSSDELVAAPFWSVVAKGIDTFKRTKG